MPIRFFSEGVNFQVSQPTRIRQWIRRVLHLQKFQESDITYIFCSDDHLLGINQRFLNHNTYTDIITFDLGSQPEKVVAEIYISVDRIEENAGKFNTEFDNELARVMIHGILHLCGYKDKTPQDKRVMREKEDTYLSLRKF